jgi:hypothetical protein
MQTFDLTVTLIASLLFNGEVGLVVYSNRFGVSIDHPGVRRLRSKVQQPAGDLAIE